MAPFYIQDTSTFVRLHCHFFPMCVITIEYDFCHPYPVVHMIRRRTFGAEECGALRHFRKFYVLKSIHSTGTGSHISAIHSFEPRKMAVHTILLDFTVDPSQVKTESQLSALSGKVENFLRNYLNNLKVVSSFNIDGGIYKLYTSDRGAVSNVRVFTNGMVTVNIEYFKAEQQEPLLNIEVSFGRLVCTKGSREVFKI